MTSIFDTIYDEDIPGFLAVKNHFWDKGRPDIVAYIRRRNLEGNWVWLATTVASYAHQPIPGYIFRERREADDEHASKMNRTTRIAAILVQAVEAALVTPDDEVPTSAAASSQADADSEPIPWVADDAAAYQSWLGKAGALDQNEKYASLQAIMDVAASDGNVKRNASIGGPVEPAAKPEPTPMDFEAKSGPEAFDPLAELKALKTGICLDMGMIKLSEHEIKFITLVLSGRLPVGEIGPLVVSAMNSPGQDLGAALNSYVTTIDRTGQHAGDPRTIYTSPLHATQFNKPLSPPAITVMNLSYTYMGNRSVKMVSEMLWMDNSPLTTVDISFCGLEEKGLLAFARGLTIRKRKGISSLRGLVLSGNYFTYRSARALGLALSTSLEQPRARAQATKYEDGSDSDDQANGKGFFERSKDSTESRKGGLRVLHVASASISPEALYQLLYGLGADCPVRELSIHSNRIGPNGAALIVEFLEGKHVPKNQTVMPSLDRLDLSNNELGNDGTAKLTRAISKRSKIHLVDLRLSSNDIGAGGVETIMNKLLQHNLISLSLDKNSIGDQGCQLVAASLQSMHQLARLNLGFNQIGSRGINTLMRTLVGCESITYLGLSGNVLKISGAIALGFTLAQHPRLEELELDNCCLGQAAQCHVVAGIISNRWVPLKKMNGFQAAPPMVALGALDVAAHSLSNEECFRLRRDEQMKTILQWMESNRAAKLKGRPGPKGSRGDSDEQYLTPEFVSSINDVQGIPSQNAYLRMLGWLSKIPFDEDELTTLRKYFYDADGGEGDRGSDGYINLKLRGDLLAALDSTVADEIRDALPYIQSDYKGSVGLDLDHLVDEKQSTSGWATMAFSLRGQGPSPKSAKKDFGNSIYPTSFKVIANMQPKIDTVSALPERSIPDFDVMLSAKKRRIHSADMSMLPTAMGQDHCTGDSLRSVGVLSSISTLSRHSLAHSSSDRSTASQSEKRASNALKARITMFPLFEFKLEELKATAKEMIEDEEDPAQQDVILTQYAEASLTILRQLRYHCMNSGLDGWRQGGLRRKVLIVDDSKVTRKLVSRAFEKANFIVDTAENGVEGFAKLKESIYDIAFMDIDMPVMNGFEATKALRQWEDIMRPGARQPICALTAAYVDDFERSELMKFKEAGLDVMESKPCNIPRLFKVVDDVSPMFSDLSISRREAQLESGSLQGL
jgi:CheY-like chemotaxis protein